MFYQLLSGSLVNLHNITIMRLDHEEWRICFGHDRFILAQPEDIRGIYALTNPGRVLQASAGHAK